jgi:GH15 family glucan-1,4-alpha-glucosidase
VAQPIENHGIVGNLRTAALIDLDGTGSFFCWPWFYSPTIFASLLDDERGGFFDLTPVLCEAELTPVLCEARQRQLYLLDTNVLLTRFLSPDGVAEISDFMTIEDLGAGSRLVRRVKAVRLHPSLAHQRGILFGSSLVRSGWPRLSRSMPKTS